MPEHEIRVFHNSPVLRIEDYRCRGTHKRPDREEWTAAHEIVFPRSGMYLRHGPEGTIVADATQVLFFHKGQPYQVGHPVPGGDRSLILSLAPSVLRELLRSFSPQVEDNPDEPFPIHQALVRTHHRLLLYFLVLALKNNVSHLEIEEKALHLLTGVFHFVFSESGNAATYTRPETKQAHDETTEQLKLVLNQGYRQHWKLHQLAHAVHTSPFHLNRLFKAQTGVSIHQYLLRLRLLAALEHIAEEPQKPFTELALELGFSTPSHFSNAFRGEFGLTPSSFRRTASVRRLHQLSKILQV